MKTEKLNYDLPTELIAQQPSGIRSDSRLLVFNRSSGELIDSRFSRLGDFLSSGDCLVLNDTKVLPAKFFCRRKTGGKIEGLFLAETAAGVWEVMLKGAGKLRTGEIIYLRSSTKQDFCRAVLLEKNSEGKCRLKLEAEAGLNTILGEIGFPPLPPYIKRTDDPVAAQKDALRYQTVYARYNGAIAAPTAGLHLTKQLINQLKTAGISFAYITLHIGMGTFKPITADELEQHQIHREQFSLDEENARLINTAKEKGRRIVAVGSTSVRTLETIVHRTPYGAAGYQIVPAGGTTSLFIKPGYKFRFVDAMVTNFHLPKSTLLALVAAFVGLDNILAAYSHAIKQRYRFYSYGDAMLIL